MELAYAAAEAVVSRAGASTIAEITVAGLPAVLVPYPYGAAHEQAANAAALADAGAAAVIPDAELTAARLVAEVEPLLLDDERRTAAAGASRALGRPDAAARLAELILATARVGPSEVSP
jgi:UDP-N-acetylglucosamine--N-acetylmuramyl-(pentapeptide) pyrophosphoryl-undecaprenol N-acetylglucosamine transferase